MNLKKLSLQEKIGQKFIFGINSDNIDIIINLIKKRFIGGVILYKKNYNNSGEMLDVIKKLKNANADNRIPLFIAIDQEGGRVNRMPSEFKNLKNIYDMSKKDETLIVRSAGVTGRMLKQMGINMNFAPVFDICEKNSKVLYNRCFCGDELDVYRLGTKYMKELSNNGIIPVIKHFPGHGATSIDSHYLIPYVYDYNKVLNKHIIPFDKVFTNNGKEVDAVMVNHMIIRKLTDGLPASISKSFISEYLRNRNNFDGLVITDEINMLSRNIFYKFSYINKMFFAGSDIILVKIKNEEEAIKLIDRYYKQVVNNDDLTKLLDDSVKRIICVKNKYDINDDISYDGCNIDEINKEIEEINRMCI